MKKNGKVKKEGKNYKMKEHQKMKKNGKVKKEGKNYKMKEHQRMKKNGKVKKEGKKEYRMKKRENGKKLEK